eukprot:632898-Lingulodinium_polyedra.AAC.1
MPFQRRERQVMVQQHTARKWGSPNARGATHAHRRPFDAPPPSNRVVRSTYMWISSRTGAGAWS